MPTDNTLQRVNSLRILFGHQSVGANILDGIRGVSGARVRIAPVVSGQQKLAAGLYELPVGENGMPATKVRGFEAALDSVGGGVDAALFKFCYVDFTARTDVEALFAEYQRVMGHLRDRYPSVTFLHVTAPLTVIQGGVKAWVKRRLGRPVWGEEENRVRHAFNERLRTAYPGLVFDLAKVESTRDGVIQTSQVSGKDVPMLRPDFTDDGGHLNDEGRRQVAVAFLEFLARAPIAGRNP